MNKREFGLVLKVGGDISNILTSLDKLQGSLNDVEMPKGLTKDLEKDILNAIQKVSEFDKRSQQAINSIEDSKEISKQWENISKMLTSLQVKLEGIKSTDIFPKDVTANIEAMKASAKEYLQVLENAKQSDTFKNKLAELEKVEEKQRILNSELKKANQALVKAETEYNIQKEQWSEETNAQYKKEQAEIAKTSQAYKDQLQVINDLRAAREGLKAEGYLTSDGTLTKEKRNQLEQLTAAEEAEASKRRSVSSYSGKVKKYEKEHAGTDLKNDQAYLALKKKQTKAENEHKKALEELKKIKKEIGDVDKLKTAATNKQELTAANNASKDLKGVADAAKEAGAALQEQKNALDQAETNYQEASQKVTGYKNELEKLDTTSENLNADLKKIQTDSAGEKWETLVEQVKKLTGIDISGSAHDMQAFTKAIEDYEAGQIEDLPNVLKKILENTKPIAPAMNNVKTGILSVGDSAKELADADREIENLKKQVLDFFSISNSIQLFKRAISSAMNTVKELDATMTEAAVVTDFSIGDMWDKLPEYSEQAKALGVSINSMYQATTLYFQQGLKNQEAMELGIETMKMAKIAGMDSTEATKAMTSALRGFNMELNEMSATRVNDVYSQLAAVTAADAGQIATAMEKTASIAASANMEFETTAAFLSQIIETTQEAPETAGTALKTIIARFAEVKSLRDQGLVSGKDEEGEIIDVNKIQTALRSVGISMEGFFNGTEGLDDVLLKLSEKWGSLDFETQRYIATMAAGSRQQSRFIAMMSDYGRTTELVSEANNSAGASQEQYEKTLDSLETALTNLKTAWEEFTMGLANQDFLKDAVNTLTDFLNMINKTVNSLSGENGLIKSLVSLVGVVGALKAGKSVFGGTGGGALSTLMGKFGLGGQVKDGEGTKPSKFGLAEGITKESGFIESFNAKRAEIKKNKEYKKMGGVQTSFKMSGSDKSALMARMEYRSKLDSISDDEAKAIKALNQQLKEGKISAEDAAKGFEKLGGDIEGLGYMVTQVGDTTENWRQKLDSFGQSMTNVGAAAIGAGTALSLLASLFESLGMEAAAETLSDIGGFLVIVGSGLSALGSILPMITALTTAQAAATWAALLPILLIVGALAAVAVAIALIAQQAHDNSLEGRMEKAAEATKEAKKAAEEAKTAYDNLLNTHSEYDDIQNSLNGLTKGTLEWKQALSESNAAVLELLETYPELAAYLTKGEDGRLVITEEGWDYMEKEAQNRAITAQKTAIQKQMAEERLKSMDQTGLIIYERAIQGELGYAAEKTLNYNPNDEVFNDKQRKEAGEKLQEDIIKEYYANKEKYDAMGDYSFAIAEKLGLQQGDESVVHLAIEEAKKENGVLYNNAKIKQTNLPALRAQAQAYLSLEASEEILQSSYGQNILEGLAGGIVQDETLETTAPETLNKMYKAFSKLDENVQRDYAALLSFDSNLVDASFAMPNLKKMAEDLGLTTEELAKNLGFTVDELEIAYEDFTKNSTSKFKIMKADFDNIFSGDTSKNIQEAFKNATIGQMSSILEIWKTSMSKEGQDAIMTGLDSVFQQATDAKDQQIMAYIDSLNWMEEGAGEKFIQYLKDIGIIIDESDEAMANFIKEMGLVNAFYKDFSLGSTFKDLEDGFNEANQVASQKELTAEQFEKYLKDGLIDEEDKKNWVFNGKGWVNIEDGMDNLVEAIKNNTLATLNLTRAEAERAKELYETKENEIKKEKRYVLTGDGDDGEIIVTKRQYEKDQEYYRSLGFTYTGTTGADEQAYEQLKSGQATTGLWSAYFDSAEEYQRWVELANGGYDDIKTLLSSTEAIANGTESLDTRGDVDFEKYYSIYSKLSALAKQKERLEKRHNKLLEEGNLAQAQANRANMRAILEEEKAKNEQLKKGKGTQINNRIAEEQNSSFLRGLGFGWNDKDGSIYYNEKALEKKSQQDQELFQDFLSEIEGLRDQWWEAEDLVIDAEISLSDLDKEERTVYNEFANQIKEALIDARQKEIDKLNEINDTINDTNSKIIASMQEQLAEERQARENAKTEQDLADKQRRLAYLQQDTSGANALDILNLQKELEEGQESYTDQLIDQKISALQEQNDKAAEQRERQIKIAKEQLELYKQGKVWDDVNEAFNDMFTEDMEINFDSKAVKMLMAAAGYDSMSEREKEEWIENLRTNAGNAKIASDSFIRPNPGEIVSFTTKEGTQLQGVTNERKEVEVNGKTYRVKKDTDGNWVQYKSGGLADFTGPAWLDGTKTKPEYILSADQTKYFFTLVDTLEGLKFRDSNSSQFNGDSIYDIDINVESISSDYDVEQVAEKVRELIVNGSRYRNNNTL